MGNIERARIRTLKMTLVIVGVFILCWTPYFVLSAWWWFDKESAAKLDPKLRSGLFLFAVSNSCMDPIVYGMFTINFKREFRRCCCCIKSPSAEKSKEVNEANKASPPQKISLRRSTSCSSSTKNAERVYIRSQDNSCNGTYIRYTPMSESLTNSRFSLSSVSRENGQSCRANINNFVGIGCMGDTI